MADVAVGATPNRRTLLTGPFSASQKPKIETLRRQLRQTTAHKMVKLPYDRMMEKFLPPVAGEPDPAYFNNIFDTVHAELEPGMYEPLVNALNTYATRSNVAGTDAAVKEALKAHTHEADGQFVVVATDSRADKTDSIRRRVDLGMYPKGSIPALEKRSDWSQIELSIEVKRDDKVEPFTSDSIDARDFLGQLVTYTELVFKKQQRTHYYTLAVFGQNASIARWDRSGYVFSETFDYVAQPAKLALFVWRLSHAATPDVLGHDLTATRIVDGSDEYKLMVKYGRPPTDDVAQPTTSDYVRELFADSLVHTEPWWKLTIPNEDPKNPPHEYLVGKWAFAAPGVVGRGTRGYVALDYTDPKHPFVYLKDCWRVVHDRSEQEGSILTHLNAKGVRYIPTALRHGDIGEKTIMARDVWMELHPKAKEECRLKNHRHYRLVVKEVGKPLKAFKDGRELVWVLLNVIIAHMDAYTIAHTIHRDLSVGNILIMPDPENKAYGVHGLLTDWELSKRTDVKDMEPRHPDRTGTWQFMSINALKESRKQIDVPDEIESIFHILLYCSIRYLPHDCHNVSDFMQKYFDDGEPIDQEQKEFTAGFFKRLVIKGGELIAPNDNHIVFLRAPQPVALAKALSTPVPPESEAPRSTTPSPPITPSTSSRPSTPTPSAPPQRIEPPRVGKYSEKDRHPIDVLIEQLLSLFKAFYELQDGPFKKATSTKLKTSAFFKVTPKLGDDEPINDTATRKSLRDAASKLCSHDEVGLIFEAALQSDNGPDPWPRDDKQHDQLDPHYRPDREGKPEAKPGTGTKSTTKRTKLHDETFEESDAKRPKSKLSQA